LYIVNKAKKTSVSATAARQSFSESLNRAAYGGERVIIRRHGKEIAAVVPIEDLRLIEQMEDATDLRAVAKARKEKGRIAWEDVKAGWRR
jgi:prevent-host-death family protein